MRGIAILLKYISGVTKIYIPTILFYNFKKYGSSYKYTPFTKHWIRRKARETARIGLAGAKNILFIYQYS